MRSKKNTIIGVIVIIIITIVSIIVLTVRKDLKEKNNNMEIIRKNYKSLITSIGNYNEIRNEYNEMSSVLIMDKYKDSHEKYVELLNKYNEEVKNINMYIDNINIRCNGLYKDSEINKICNTYKITYEKLVNLYVSDIDNYNEFIEKYNEYKKESLDKIEKIQKDYIDYNNDGKYEGRDSSEKN